MAVQESEFLPPPTQLDILYGFTDLIIVGRMVTKVFILRVTRLYCSEGGNAEDWEIVPTTVRFDVVVSVLLLSAFFARLLTLTSAPLALSW